VNSAPLSERRWIQARHYYNGVGNRLSVDTLIFLLALMDNRTMVVKGFHLKEGRRQHFRGNAYLYDASILDHNATIEDAMNASLEDPPFYIQVHDSWWDANFDEVFGTRHLMDLQQLIYSPMAYAQTQMSEFCQKNFGMHAIYFLSNFIVHIDENVFDAAHLVINSVPKKIRIFGVHLRVQYPGQFYSYSFDQTLSVVTPFLREKLAEGKTVLGFASDAILMEQKFMGLFGKFIIQTRAFRKADFDHTSAMVDLIFLEMCNDCLLSFRSTFSFAVASRKGQRCYFVEKEAPEVFQLGNSQSGSISMLFHRWDVNDWQTSRRFMIHEKDEWSIRYYYKYLMM
jgi:hypothetical protein